MSDHIGTITRPDPAASHAVHAISATHEDARRDATGAARTHPTAAEHAAIELASASTELSFHVDDTHRIVVQVTERATGKVVRSFRLVLPGADPTPEERPPPGSLLDVTV